MNGTITIVRIDIRKVNDSLVADSNDVPGLHVSAPSSEELNQRVVKAIKFLFKVNRHVDVEVRPFADIKDFPKAPAVGSQSKFALMAAAA